MLEPTRKFLTLAVATLAISGLATASFAGTAWQNHHPRRAEINARLTNQSRRIHQERKEGEISGRQAARLHRQDRTIRREERVMARAHGGHLTKPEQRALNRHENRVSRRIGK